MKIKLITAVLKTFFNLDWLEYGDTVSHPSTSQNREQIFVLN